MRAALIIGLVFLLSSPSPAQMETGEEQIKTAVRSFYEWYIGTTKDRRYSTYVRGAAGENGKTKLETGDYFTRLDSLGVLSEEFVSSEKERLRPCDSLLGTVDWKTFQKADAYEYEDQCPFLYYYYWTFGQEPHDGVEVSDVVAEGEHATVKAHLYFSSFRAGSDQAKVHLTKKTTNG